MANPYDQFRTGQQAPVVPQVQDEDETTSVTVQPGADSNPYAQFLAPKPAPVADPATTVAPSATLPVSPTRDVRRRPSPAQPEQPQPTVNPYDEFRDPEQKAFADKAAGATRKAGPALDPEAGRLKTATGAVLSGVGAGYGGMVKYPALKASAGAEASIRNAGHTLELMDMVDRGDITDAPRNIDPSLGKGLNYYLYMYSKTKSPEYREAVENLMERAEGREKDPRNRPFYKAGEKIDEFFSQMIGQNPEFMDEFFTGDVAQGFGSMLSFITLAPLGLPGIAMGGMAMNASAEFEQALDDGASLAEAMEASEYAGLAGLSEAAPIISILNRIDKGSGGVITRAVKNLFKGGGEELIQELFQTVFGNLIASDIVKYNPERGMWEGSGKAAGVGFTTGALMDLLMTIATGGRRRRRPEDEYYEFDEETGQVKVDPETGEKIKKPIVQPPRMGAEEIIGAVEEEAPPPTPAAAAPDVVPAEELAAREAAVAEISEREVEEERRVAEAERRVAEEPFLEEKREVEEERRAPVELEAKEAVLPFKKKQAKVLPAVEEMPYEAITTEKKAPPLHVVEPGEAVRQKMRLKKDLDMAVSKMVGREAGAENQEIDDARDVLRSRLVPALKTKKGDIVQGKLGDIHNDILNKVPEGSIAVASGFFDSQTGEFRTKKELQYLGSEDLMTAEELDASLKKQFPDLIAKEARVLDFERRKAERERGIDIAPPGRPISPVVEAKPFRRVAPMAAPADKQSAAEQKLRKKHVGIMDTALKLKVSTKEINRLKDKQIAEIKALRAEEAGKPKAKVLPMLEPKETFVDKPESDTIKQFRKIVSDKPSVHNKAAIAAYDRADSKGKAKIESLIGAMMHMEVTSADAHKMKKGYEDGTRPLRELAMSRLNSVYRDTRLRFLPEKNVRWFLTKEEENAIDQAAELFHKDVVYIRPGTEQARGIGGIALIPTVRGVQQTKNIYIVSNTGMSPIKVFGHELVHHLRNDHTDLYDKLAAIVLLKNPELSRHAVAVKDADLLTEELIADFIGDNLTNRNMWDAVLNANPTMLQQLIDIMTKWIEAIKYSFRLANKSTMQSEEFVENTQQMLKVAGEVMSEYAARQQKVVKGYEKFADVVVREAVRPKTIMEFWAKKGGFNREEAKAQGIDPADFTKRYAGKYLFPAKGGMTFDQGAEAAREQGENVYGPNEVLAIMYDHLRGVTMTQEEVNQDYEGLEAADKAREEDVSIHKIFKTGKWVGAPDFVKSGKDLAKMRAVLRQLASEGEARRFWYEESGKAILDYFGNVEEATKFAKVIAIYASRQAVSGNTTQALKAWYQYKAGKPIKVGMGRIDKSASNQLYDNKDWSGLKTNSFYQNMMFGIDPSQAKDMVTVDMWMMGAMNFHTQAPSEQQYAFVEREIRRLATEIGWAPHQVQAAVWSSYRTRATEANDDLRIFANREKATQGSAEWFHLQHKLAMEESVTPEQVMKGGYSFADALHERTVHFTADVAPGYRTGVLPNFASLNLKIQTEYMHEVNAVENGDIARMLDLPVGVMAEGYYASNSEVGVAGNIFVPMATEPEVIPGRKTPGPRQVTEEMSKKLNKYIAMRGYVFSQEEVLWHYPIYDAAKSKHDGVDVQTARPLDAYETRILYDALKTHFDSQWIAPGGLENGARVINLTQNESTQKHEKVERIIPNDEFQKGVKEVMDALPRDFGGGVVATRGFQHQGSYISNNNKKFNRGWLFRQIFDAEHLPALKKMRDRIKLINEKYANMPEVKRIDDLVAKHTVVPFPVNGKATDRPGALNSVRVFYYGREKTRAVSASPNQITTRYSQEQKRTKGHKTLENRINLYTQPQKDMAFGVVHKAVVHNIYDSDADVQGLRIYAQSHEEGVRNGFEVLVLAEGFDGYKKGDRIVMLGSRIMEVHPSTKEAFAGPELEVKYSVTPPQQKKMPDPLDVMDALREGRPIEAILRAMFKYTGIRWATRGAMNQWNKLYHERKFKNAPPGSYREWFNNGIERVRVGIIDRHGIPQAHLDASDRQKMNEREIAMKGADIVAELIKSGTIVGTAESEILQGVLTGEKVADEHWEKVAAPIRKAIDELGQAAVEYGLISQDSYNRNRLTYLHRVYRKHEDVGMMLRGVRKIFSARRKALIGSSIKGRGMWVEISADKMMADTETAYNITVKKGDKLIMYSKFSNLERPGNVWKRPKVLERVLVPSGRDVDMSSYEKDPAWVNSGEWEIRETSKKKGKEYTLWRDHTKEERTRMGEILDAKYTILKTFHSMAHDLSTGQMFAEIADNPDLTYDGEGEPEGSVDPTGFGWSTYIGVDWVRVPTAKIKDTGGKFKYGKLAGKYVRGGVWRDLADMDKMQSPGVWRTLMTQWKLNKTARNPVVHMNNIMANVALMDMADVRGRDLYRAFKAMLDRENPEGDWRKAEIAGAFDNSFVLEEIKKNRMDPMLRDLLSNMTKESEKDAASVVGVANTLHNMFTTMHKHMAKFDQWSIDKYQMEDMVFRMALFMRRTAQGIEPLIAAREARDQFINYDIKAPWINMLRRTVLPFLSYTYRAVPMVANTIANRPHKIFKYAMIMYLANYMGYALDDEGGDEDDERSVLRDMDNGITWAMTPKLIRMFWRDSYGNPVFLDMKRWLPAADIFDTGQSWIPQPLQWSGPLQLGFELLMNRSMYFDREIYDKDTATYGDKVSALGWHAYRSWVPSAPWVPGSWYQQKIGKAVLGFSDPQGRQYSVNQALLNSIGIKLKPLDVGRRKMQEVSRLTFQLRSLTKDIYYLERDRDRAPEYGITSVITNWWYDKERAALVRKIEAIAKKLDKLGLVQS